MIAVEFDNMALIATTHFQKKLTAYSTLAIET